ncbi:C4-dicarboxylate transporter DcuC [Campylobacter gracilis]|uniref:Transporter, anaerobic C4-dicarboxylate uptake C (DcuC) family n=1 Tax=Campylobacter gracilis RM3268 TaxID=553220 RepID=C8PI77_9BACT|nr:C4-dicarboxylate transporter DcuC [Campylobacter gracilis]AKT91587.1 putative C4-dicarboxylate transporter, DcuC family [Campylobacter gracilis]EEV17467.1 transporter, anaerobic C4-dicarboxylate uptake C (DcuC) family [Campylobacter gracilis RM3268]UEB46202.1 C4-dicarboxylate transporter DcuC [Campylobacter gracilis]SUW77966.1 orotate phosphoribosyltransferase [Campylobacter gracilis]
MQTFRLFLALAGIVAVVALLIMKKDTKTVLIGVGLVLCVLCLKPLDGLNAFTSYMTKAGLIKAICASMGFAFVMKFTECDRALVNLLTRPLGNIGFLLIPIVVALTYFINIAIPSAAGCSAAVGATLIPVMMAAGVKPEMAGAAVFAGTFGGVLSPGSAHNVFVADMVKAHNPSYTVQDVIGVQFSSAITALIVVLIVISITAIVCKDYTKGVNYLAQKESGANSVASNSADGSNLDAQPQKINVLYALMPLVPLVILIIGGTSKLNTISFLKWTKMGVAEAMLLGAIVTIVITMSNPQKITKEFFKGMGSAYAEIIGIIIAAGVFVAGLSACGAIDFVIEWLKGEQGYVKFGGTFVPFFMGVVTGSGDAASMAFNTAVTVHADALGFEQDKLGMAVAISGALGRSASPIAGACIVCAGLAMVSPIQIAKRTALGMFLSVCIIAFFIL